MNLREARTNRFLTMRDLAAKAGVSLGTVRDTESGQTIPTLRIAKSLADALEADPTTIAEFVKAVEKAQGERRRK